MEFRILGPLEVDDAGRRVELGGTRQQALLAILLLHRGEIVAADTLIEELYAGAPPPTAAKSLQAHVSRLRKALGGDGRLQTRSRGYTLTLTSGELDLDRFVELHERGRTELAEGDPESAAASLHEALALWRGVPFGDLAYDDFVQSELSRLEELRSTCIEDRIDADLALGRHASLVGELEQLVAEHPLRERLREQLMLALYRSHRQAEALEAYQHARRVLVDELGIDPGRSLRELEKAILRQDPSLEHVPSITATGDEPDTARGIFVGREAELAELLAGLEDVVAGRGRLFLLAGEPGIGKSRLGDELIRHAKARGALVLVGRCWEAGGAPAYWPWVQSLRAYIREVPPETLRAQLGAARRTSRRSCPSCARSFPGFLTRSRSTPRARASACSTQPPSSFGTPPRAGRSCSSSTISTPPMRRLSSSCSLWPASSTRRASSSSAPSATSTRSPASRSPPCWPTSRASRRLVACRSGA